MSFVSYAQNFEDVMLWRALKHVECGFYIDVGAAWPDEHSVTKAFYDRGWSGINIEPNPRFYRQLEESRPKDKNLQLAVGGREHVCTMHFVGNTGLSTLDEAIAEKHHEAGWDFDREEVQVTTLASIWQQHVPDGQEVHFLKVDVEGFEEAALRGNDWTRYRPWIVVVEATLPMSREESYESWESILLDANYRFAYADGLNRFYVANEHREHLSAFKYPPNVFDDFVLIRQQDNEARAKLAEARATQAETRATQAATRATRAETRATQAETHVAQLLNSISWRITAPLRWAGAILHGLTSNALKSRIKSLLQHAALYVSRRPRLKRVVLFVLNGIPGLKSRLARVVGGGVASPWMQYRNVPSDLSQLAPHARQIYADLKTAIEHRQKGNG